MSRMYRNRKEYIETLRTILDAKEDFKDLEYHKHPSTQEEFLFMSDILGRVFYFDITGMPNEQIFHSMAMVEVGQVPECYITDKARMLEIGRFFN